MLKNNSSNSTSVLLPYNDVLEIVDILEELEDRNVLNIVAQGRRAIAKGTKGIQALASFNPRILKE